MKVLIIAAHGSRKKESNIEVASLVQQVVKKAQDKFDLIEHAFLQMAQPLLESKMEELARKGAKQMVIFPLFIGSGSHITIDIPALVQKTQASYPDIEIRVTRHLGKIEAIEDVIIHEVTT